VNKVSRSLRQTFWGYRHVSNQGSADY
jgi:hypothetical protein